MSKVIKFRRRVLYLDVYLNASDSAGKYFTNICYDAFRYVTGISLKEGETKYVRITEVKRARLTVGKALMEVRRDKSDSVSKKKQEVRRKKRVARRATDGGPGICAQCELDHHGHHNR